MQRNKISFKGQKIYIGIDVHAKTWEVCVLTESGYRERHPQQASAKTLFDFLKKHFPDGEYHAGYEAGFSGFATYYALKEYGIDCVVTHAADVPTTQYEEVMKTDKVDAAKLARSLRAGDIRPIYIRERENIDDRAVIRIRKTIQKQLSGYKSRVKHLLHCNGVEIPDRFASPGTHWSSCSLPQGCHWTCSSSRSRRYARRFWTRQEPYADLHGRTGTGAIASS